VSSTARIAACQVSGLRFARSALQACEGADALVIVTEWKEFRSPDFAAIKARLKSPLLFDGRNLYEPALLRSTGLSYSAIGRKAAGVDPTRQ